MKIAQIVSTFPPYRGGTGTVAKEYALRLMKLGHEVTVFTPAYSKIISPPKFSFQVERLKPYFRFGNAAFLPQLAWRLAPFDVVHLHYPFFGGAEMLNAAMNAKLKQKRYIITYHQDPLGVGALGIIFAWYKENIMPTIIENAHKVLVSSRDYLEHSDLKNIALKKLTLFEELPFGVDTDRFFPKEKDHEFLESNGIDPKIPVVLFVGGMDRAHYFKGVDDLIRAIHFLREKNVSVQLACVGNGKLIAGYKLFMESLGIAKSVHFFEKVSDEELPKWYQSSDVFVLPSATRGEAFGIVLLEAMASGKPVIASNLPGVRSVVRENENGFLFEPKNSKDLAEKIQTIIENSMLKKEMGENSRKIVLEKYVWDDIIDRLVKWYAPL